MSRRKHPDFTRGAGAYRLTAGEGGQGTKVSIRIGFLKCGDVLAAQCRWLGQGGSAPGEPWPSELHGIAQAFFERVGGPWQEPAAGYRRDSLHTVRTTLGEEQFERAYATGMALSLDQALDLASGRTRPAVST